MEQTIILGDSSQVLTKIKDNFFDSVVTDPPYELTSIVKRFGKEGSAPAKEGTDGRFSRLSKGFMGHEWDGTGIQRDPEFWKEVLRVMKPGAYILAFGGTRTFYRMACAMEDAGFVIRDTISWLYGSGFPKSHDISKNIDKHLGKEREVVGQRESPSKPNAVKTQKWGFGSEPIDVTIPASEEAKKWEGWGTALKPGFEPIILAQKPLSEKTIVANVLKWGVGAINIDDSRIAIEDGEIIPINKLESWSGFGQEIRPDYIQEYNTKGRWPSNVILDEESAELLPSARRFFYCAKATKKEKEVNGISHPTSKPISLMEYLVKLITPKDGYVLEPFMGGGSTIIACNNLNLSALGIEKEETYFELVKNRFTNLNIQYKTLSI